MRTRPSHVAQDLQDLRVEERRSVRLQRRGGEAVAPEIVEDDMGAWIEALEGEGEGKHAEGGGVEAVD